MEKKRIKEANINYESKSKSGVIPMKEKALRGNCLVFFFIRPHTKLKMPSCDTHTCIKHPIC